MASGNTYVKFLPALAQRTIRSPRDGRPVDEGCGPIAVAMCIIHWRRRGYEILPQLENRRSLVRGLYELLGASRRRDGSFTPPTRMYAGMQRLAKGSQLVAHHLRPGPWRIMEQVLCTQLRKGRPVVILMRREPACLDENEKTWKGWHYVVACGYQGNDVALITGWATGQDQGFGAHRRASGKGYDQAHVLCTFAELRRARISMFWYAPRKSVVPRTRWPTRSARFRCDHQ